MNLAMHPENIDYAYIDQPLRGLLRAVNGSAWARTAGCCAGAACHESGEFYILLEVRGLEGVQRLQSWMSLSRACGLKSCFEGPTIKAFALPEAEMVVPEHLSGYAMPETSFMGRDWIVFDLHFHLGDASVTREQTQGGIRALELGWRALQEVSGESEGMSPAKYREEGFFLETVPMYGERVSKEDRRSGNGI
jgi:hypothetical protein